MFMYMYIVYIQKGTVDIQVQKGTMDIQVQKGTVDRHVGIQVQKGTVDIQKGTKGYCVLRKQLGEYTITEYICNIKHFINFLFSIYSVTR